jgi:hypothetical protein
MKAMKAERIRNEINVLGNQSVQNHQMVRNSSSNLRNLMVAIISRGIYASMHRTNEFLTLTQRRLSSANRDTMRRAGLTDLTLPEDLIWTVPVTPLEEQLPQPTRAPPQRIPILKYGPASTRLVPQQPLTRAVWLCVRPVASSSLTPRRARRCANAEARRRRLNIL